jgi:DNA polymerase III subunit epsilon
MTLIAGLDLESTGVDPANDRIVEVAVVVMELETGITRMRFERRVNPGQHIPAGAVEIHGISDADVMGAPSFRNMAPGIVALLSRVDLIVAHNGEAFDGPLLVHEIVRSGVSLPATLPPVFDTMLEGRGCTSDGKVPNLGELCYALDVDYDPARAHGALYDVEVLLAAFRRGWELGVFHPSVLEVA